MRSAAPPAWHPPAELLRYLDDWLETRFSANDERSRIRAKMLRALTFDPPLVEQGWSRVAEIAGVW